jgi:hypothetical protein
MNQETEEPILVGGKYSILITHMDVIVESILKTSEEIKQRKDDIKRKITLP